MRSRKTSCAVMCVGGLCWVNKLVIFLPRRQAVELMRDRWPCLGGRLKLRVALERLDILGDQL